jgi:diguanylate cyclase
VRAVRLSQYLFTMPNTHAESPRDQQGASSLSDLRLQCEAVRVLVADSIERLAAAYPSADSPDICAPLPEDKSAAAAREAIRTTMQQASGALLAIVTRLDNAARERELLAHRFAAALEQEEAARTASLHDHLTGMPNRALFHDRLQHGIEQATRHGWLLALMFVDLNGFKQINDRYGHDVGDSVLQAIAGRLRDNSRSDDSVSRHGGDEFLYLALDVRNEACVVSMAAKLVQMLQAPIEVSIKDDFATLSVGASIGISMFPAHGTDGSELVRSADRAMYRAKRASSGYAFPC